MDSSKIVTIGDYLFRQVDLNNLASSKIRELQGFFSTSNNIFDAFGNTWLSYAYNVVSKIPFLGSKVVFNGIKKFYTSKNYQYFMGYKISYARGSELASVENDSITISRFIGYFSLSYDDSDPTSIYSLDYINFTCGIIDKLRDELTTKLIAKVLESNLIPSHFNHVTCLTWPNNVILTQALKENGFRSKPFKQVFPLSRGSLSISATLDTSFYYKDLK